MAKEVPPATVLVVDDDRGLLRLIQKALQQDGVIAVTAVSGKEATDWLSRNHADLMLLDLKLPDIEGKDLVNHLAEVRRTVPFIVITGQGDERVAVDMMKRGALDYLTKDVEFLQFVPGVVRRALNQLAKEKRLAEVEEQARLSQTVVEQGFSAVLITTTEQPNPRVVYVNPAFTRLTGCVAVEMIGQSLDHLESRVGMMPELRRALSDEKPFSCERVVHRRNVGLRIVDCQIAPVFDLAGQRTHWVIIQSDITERKRLEKEVLEISEREQRRIGQDLHDGLGQQLTAIELMCEILRTDLGPGRPELNSQVARLSRHLREAIGQTRNLARGLAPFKVEEGGLQVALLELAQTTSSLGRLKCRVLCPSPVAIEDGKAAAHLYRIAQEAVNNAVKYSRASEVTIHLSRRGGVLQLQVSDNGRGFPRTKKSGHGMGLQVMNHRANVIGAELVVASQPDKGVTILCTLTRSD